MKQHQALSPFTKPGAQSLPSPCTVERGRGTGWEAAGERAEASVDLLGAGVGRASLRCASRGLALSWLGAEGLLGRGGLGGVWEVGAALPAWGVAVCALLEVLSFSSGLPGLSAGGWVSATFSTAVLLSFPTSAPAGSPSCPTLPAAISVLSSGDCRSGLALLSIFPLMANLPRWCVQTNVPASEPGLYEPGSRVLEHSLHLPRRRKSPVRWERPSRAPVGLRRRAGSRRSLQGFTPAAKWHRDLGGSHAGKERNRKTSSHHCVPSVSSQLQYCMRLGSSFSSERM